jgi:hypothetical protein
MAYLFLSLAALIGILAFGIWGMWPRKRLKAGRHNNWAQRDGTELFSDRNTAEDIASVAARHGHGSGLI